MFLDISFYSPVAIAVDSVISIKRPRGPPCGLGPWAIAYLAYPRHSCLHLKFNGANSWLTCIVPLIHLSLEQVLSLGKHLGRLAALHLGFLQTLLSRAICMAYVLDIQSILNRLFNR